MAAVDVRAIGAEGGHLVFLALGDHQHHAELRPDRDGTRKNLLHALRRRIRRDVKIHGFLAQEPVAHAAPAK